MSYKLDNRNYENTNKGIFTGVGEFDIPELARSGVDDIEECKFIGFNYAKQVKNPENYIVHFFLDDYQFLRLWNKPQNYIELFRKFKAILSPDFSLYTDYPKALQIYNHYRKMWLSAYYQSEGVRVIPTQCWSDEESYKFCFDGMPFDSMVAISSVGTQMNKESKELFTKGFNRMVECLAPSKVILFGDADIPFPEYKVLRVQSDQSKRFNKLRRQ